jgi:hypothetical protein
MTGLEVLYHPHFEPDIGMLRSTLLISDAVHSIVPTGSGFVPSEAIRRHMDLLPGTFVEAAPEDDKIAEAACDTDPKCPELL